MKDYLRLIFVTVSIILVGTVAFEIVDSQKEKPLVKKIIETEIYTAEPEIDLGKYNSVINRIEQIEIDIKLIKKVIEPVPVINPIELNHDGSSTVTWPPRMKFNLKSPSSVE